MRLTEFTNSKKDIVNMFGKFLPLAMEILELDSLPKFVFDRELDTGSQPSFGMYDADNRVLYVALANRHPVDILRTVAHELVHYKQDLLDQLQDDSGKTGSPEENQANELAGVILRNFNKQYPEFLKIKPLVLELRLKLAEGVNDYLWHGSKSEHEILYPQQANDTGGKEESNKNAVYATPSAKVAIAMGLTTPDSDTGMFPNDPQMIMFSGKIRKGQMVYLHKVPKNLFIKHHDREWYSKPGVKEVKPLEIKAVPVDQWLHLIRQATPQDLELRKKYMKKQGVAEGSYREGGSITHDGVEYDFDSVMSIAEKLPTKTCSVDKLSWVLKYDTPDEHRVKKADISVPLIVTKSVNGKLAAIDGLHRLTKAVRNGVKTLPVKYIEPNELESAKLKQKGVEETSLFDPVPSKINNGDLVSIQGSSETWKVIAVNLQRTRAKIKSQDTGMIHMWDADKLTKIVDENFADGRNPQDKGDSARHGIRKGMTIAQLKKIRSSDSASPRKKQLAHWQINMRQGKKK